MYLSQHSSMRDVRYFQENLASLLKGKIATKTIITLTGKSERERENMRASERPCKPGGQNPAGDRTAVLSLYRLPQDRTWAPPLPLPHRGQAKVPHLDQTGSSCAVSYLLILSSFYSCPKIYV